ncbi:glycosyl transferase family 2 [Hydrogenispora ethanolica]|uniref:Glycosyl transferase family 2 n=1 Tax=Hydrogenispora ethanolica TaxID=1082276 RepID=A0A4V2QBP0_HYDET|nr:glycosyltransferase family 2 protein [Hydrogenispora ethanolica]TCL57122.1 glycosyl transferase family 2 [Hydrogenispora ethanolica]
MEEGKKELITVLIPAYNESANIEATITAVKNTGKVDQIIVINDCSSDQTSELARRTGADVLDLPKNMGKGGALNYGLQNAKGSIIALLDGDLGKSAAEVEKLIEPIINNKADMTIGKFPPALRKGGFGLVTTLAKKGIRWFTGLEVASPLSGQRVMRLAVIQAIGAFESGFGVEVGLTIDVFRHGFRVKEVPVQMTHAETGRDLAGFLHRGQQFWDVVAVLTKRLFKR